MGDWVSHLFFESGTFIASILSHSYNFKTTGTFFVLSQCCRCTRRQPCLSEVEFDRNWNRAIGVASEDLKSRDLSRIRGTGIAMSEPRFHSADRIVVPSSQNRGMGALFAESRHIGFSNVRYEVRTCYCLAYGSTPRNSAITFLTPRRCSTKQRPYEFDPHSSGQPSAMDKSCGRRHRKGAGVY